jgi:cellulose synthase/poly-beta-1,6-N-acetylglucosamine synthase-like glycosyltransferase
MEVAVIEHDGEKRECYSCCGSGKRNKRVKESGKWRRIEVTCNACEGVGFIRRTKHRSEDGTWRKKRVAKSYPSFEAPPPFPLGDMGDVNLMEKENEELSFLVGQWKIFQRMDRHRYSTDDLVTSWIAAQEMKQLGYIDPLVLDIGMYYCIIIITLWHFMLFCCMYTVIFQPSLIKQ